MFKQIMNEHKEEQEAANIKMQVLGIFSNPLNRQLEESIRIKNKDPALLLNSKSEFYGQCLKRKVFENWQDLRLTMLEFTNGAQDFLETKLATFRTLDFKTEFI